MLNKILAGVPLALLSLNVFAMPMECPPLSALHHPEQNKEWILDKKYADQGWNKGSDFYFVKKSLLKELPVGIVYTVQLRANDYWKAVCYYTIPGDLPLNENVIMVSTTQSFDKKKIPQPPFIYFQDSHGKGIYSCSSDQTSRHCIWELSAPPIPPKAK